MQVSSHVRPQSTSAASYAVTLSQIPLAVATIPQELRRWNTSRLPHIRDFASGSFCQSACSPLAFLRNPYVPWKTSLLTSPPFLSSLDLPQTRVIAPFPRFPIDGTLKTVIPFSHDSIHICEYVRFDGFESSKNLASILILFISLALPGPWQRAHQCCWNGFPVCKNHQHFHFLYRMEKETWRQASC